MKTIGRNILSIEHYEYKWIEKHHLNLDDELMNTTCFRTRKQYHGVLREITIACIDYPHPCHLIWWYKNPNNM